MKSKQLDKSLAQEFAGQDEAILRLKSSNPKFRALVQQNHALWVQIQISRNAVTSMEMDYLRSLEKERLAVLDDIARMLAGAIE